MWGSMSKGHAAVAKRYVRCESSADSSAWIGLLLKLFKQPTRIQEYSGALIDQTAPHLRAIPRVSTIPASALVMS